MVFPAGGSNFAVPDMPSSANPGKHEGYSAAHKYIFTHTGTFSNLILKF